MILILDLQVIFPFLFQNKIHIDILHEIFEITEQKSTLGGKN